MFFSPSIYFPSLLRREKKHIITLAPNSWGRGGAEHVTKVWPGSVSRTVTGDFQDRAGGCPSALRILMHRSTVWGLGLGQPSWPVQWQPCVENGQVQSVEVGSLITDSLHQYWDYLLPHFIFVRMTDISVLFST